MRHCVVAGLLFVIAAIGSPVFAGQSRAAEVEQEQAEKARRLHPYQPTRDEVWLSRAARALSSTPRGLYPWLGSAFPGSLLTLGPGVRLPLARTGFFDAQAAYSLKGYTLARATVALPPLAGRRLRVALQGGIVNAPKVAFFGLGNDAPSEARSTFVYRPKDLSASADLMAIDGLRLGASLGYLAAESRQATSGTPVEARFDAADLPGLGAAPHYRTSEARAAYDWRDSLGYSRRGGLYRVDWTSYDQRNGTAYSFRRVDVDVLQLVPLLRENWVFFLRATASSTSTDDGQEVPYFLLPQLGGGSDLRGYPVWRFRDRHRLLLTGEYRWTPSHFVDMALFVDAGKVTSSRAELDLDGLKRSYGIGIRFHAPAATLLRVDLARTTQGLALIFGFGQGY
jgi:hypothetical protein